MWIYLTLLSAIFAATRRTQEKRLTNHLHHFSIAFATQAFALPIMGIAVLAHGVLLNPLHLGLRFWLPLIITSIGFYPLNAFLYLQAIKQAEISNVLPLQSLGPVFSLLPAWLTLGQIPTWIGIIGIAMTVCGVYVLGLQGRALHHPLQPFRDSAASRYMFYAILLSTASAVLDKTAVSASDAIYYSFSSTIGAVIVLGVTLRITKITELDRIRQDVKELARIGSLQGASYMTYLMAIALGPLAYVSAVRSSNILMGSVLGILILGERFTTPKLLSFFLIASGALLLAYN